MGDLGPFGARDAGARAFRFSAAFWDGIESHRASGHYRFLRRKVAEFVSRKAASLAPANGRDKPFHGESGLRGVHHVSLMRSPDVVLFYVSDAGVVTLGPLGSHHDYPNGGRKGDSRALAARVANAAAGRDVRSPLWSGLRWSGPEDLLAHPDLPELSPKALSLLAEELAAEAETGVRYAAQRGHRLEDAPEDRFDAYLAEVARAAEAVIGLRRRALGVDSWLPPEVRGPADADGRRLR